MVNKQLHKGDQTIGQIQDKQPTQCTVSPTSKTTSYKDTNIIIIIIIKLEVCILGVYGIYYNIKNKNDFVFKETCHCPPYLTQNV